MWTSLRTSLAIDQFLVMCHQFILKHWLLLIAAYHSKYLRRWRNKSNFITYMLYNCTGLRKMLTTATAMQQLFSLCTGFLMAASVSLLSALQLLPCLLPCSWCKIRNVRAALLCKSLAVFLQIPTELFHRRAMTKLNVMLVPGRGGYSESYWKIMSVIRNCHLNYEWL